MAVNAERNLALVSAILKNLGLALLLVAVEEVLIFSDAGFSSSGTGGGYYMPPIPGWLIGLIWVILFAGLGVVRGVMEANGSPDAHRASTALLVLLFACAAYPFYTLGLRDDLIGLVGNVATLGLSVWAAIRVRSISRAGAVVPLTLAGWLLFASAALIDDGRFMSRPQPVLLAPGAECSSSLKHLDRASQGRLSGWRTRCGVVQTRSLPIMFALRNL